MKNIQCVSGSLFWLTWEQGRRDRGRNKGTRARDLHLIGCLGERARATLRMWASLFFVMLFFYHIFILLIFEGTGHMCHSTHDKDRKHLYSQVSSSTTCCL